MIRLFVSAEIQKDGAVALDDKQRHYLLHVMRVRVGEIVRIFNGRDGLWDAAVAVLDKKQGVLTPVRQVSVQPAAGGPDLYMALIKKENFDLIVQKATELGVRAIHPVVTARSVVTKMNQERVQAIAVEAAEQCERLDVPVVHAPVSLAAALAESEAGRRVVFLNERGATSGVLGRDENVAFFIGPEGGFTDAELGLMAAYPGVLSLNLGSRILRAETAAIAALAAYTFKSAF